MTSSRRASSSVWSTITEEVSVDDLERDRLSSSGPHPSSEFRLAWLFIEGRREQLRRCGDVVEQHRWEWRLDRTMHTPNRVPSIVAKTPMSGVLLFSGVGINERVVRRRSKRKSVRWAGV